MKFSRLFYNPFLEPSVSRTELLACATDAKERLRANSEGGAFDGLVAGISAALAGMGAATVADLTKLGRRKGAKMFKKQFRAGLPDTVARIAAGVMGHYGSRSGELRKVLPRGRQALVRTPDDAMGAALASLVAALIPLEQEMGAAGTRSLQLAQGLQSGWAEVYGVSEASTGEKAVAEAGLRAARVRLGAQLHVALLSVTAHFAAAAAAEGKVLSKKEAARIAALYFRQDLLKDRTRRKVAEQEV